MLANLELKIKFFYELLKISEDYLNKTLKIIGFGFQDDDFEADVLQVGKVKGISNEVGAIQILRHTFRGLFRPPGYAVYILPPTGKKYT
jgi:hypothetical protein